MPDNHDLRGTFNRAARDYDAIRPPYPEQLFDDIIALSGIQPGDRALEIGCGTGQATLPFAKRGYKILCLDIGPDLLAIAKDHLRAYPNVRFTNIAFEDWPLQAGEYFMVYAATAFHWIAREVGYAKSVQALKPGGALAIFSNAHPRPYSGFFAEVQPVYSQYLPELLDAKSQQTTADAIRAQTESMQATGLFATVEVRTYPWMETYTTAEYLQLLNTYSGHRAIDDTRRRGLYAAIADLIEKRYAGKVERPYLTELFLGKKASSYQEKIYPV
jgi:ubiquinone/menaquinone biosynthesis C-methylase UbiE